MGVHGYAVQVVLGGRREGERKERQRESVRERGSERERQRESVRERGGPLKKNLPPLSRVEKKEGGRKGG